MAYLRDLWQNTHHIWQILRNDTYMTDFTPLFSACKMAYQSVTDFPPLYMTVFILNKPWFYAVYPCLWQILHLKWQNVTMS